MVYHATRSDSAEEVAIKTVRKPVHGVSVCYEDVEEIDVWRHVHKGSPDNVVSLLDVKQSPTYVFVIMELMRGGDLSRAMRQGEVRDERDAWRLFSHLIAGVSACHGAGVCHRDLKPLNLLITGRGGTLKVADFGLSTRLAGTPDASCALLSSPACTPDYAAPEVLRGLNNDGYKADMWSCGVILYELLMGHLPFVKYTQGRLSAAIVARYNDRVYYPPCMAGGAKDLLFRLLDTDPTTRWSVHQAREHPWLQGGVARPSVEGRDDMGGFGIIVAVALYGKPAWFIADVIRSLATHNVQHVQDLMALVRQTGTSCRLKRWLLRKGFPSTTAERLTTHLSGA